MSFAEKNMQSLFTSYLKKKYDGKSAAFELKIAKGNTLPFSRIEPHQLDALYRSKHEKLAFKISDFSPGYKPFDQFFLSKADAFLVILFYKPREIKELFFIDIDVILNEIQKSKSLSKERAVIVASKIIKL